MAEKRATQSICAVDKAETIDNYQTVQSKSERRKYSNTVNLSNRQLMTDEVFTLEPGLSFCQTTKYLNKEQNTTNFITFLYNFEYFHQNPNLQDSQGTNIDVDTDILDSRKRNPD